MYIGKLEFFETINNALTNNLINLSPDALTYYQALADSSEEEKKSILSENAKKILEFLQNNPNKPFKSKDIANEIEISSRSVSGSIRKLVNENLVEKINKEPCIYMITEKGINFKGE